jgi:hypothetical protein
MVCAGSIEKDFGGDRVMVFLGFLENLKMEMLLKIQEIEY